MSVRKNTGGGHIRESPAEIGESKRKCKEELLMGGA